MPAYFGHVLWLDGAGRTLFLLCATFMATTRPQLFASGGLARPLMSGLNWKADIYRAATNLLSSWEREPYALDGTCGKSLIKHPGVPALSGWASGVFFVADERGGEQGRRKVDSCQLGDGDFWLGRWDL